MKKLLSLTLAMVLALSLVGCGGTKTDSEAESATDTFELALVTDVGSIDDRSFNQGAWEGLEKYAKEAGKTYKYYRPTEKSVDGYLTGISQAVENGAKIVVCPGFLFSAAVLQAQDQYPDVKFIVLDTRPQSADYTQQKTASNTYSIIFNEEQSGFLAGYAAVKDGYRNLGFLGGMAVPAVVRFGYGYVQGAEYAANELGLKAGDVKIKYGYTGGFDPDPAYQTKAASWYSSGTQVIFSCGGLIINNVTAAAEAASPVGAVIGVDGDQKAESETVITSAMKMLTTGVYEGIKAYYEGKFPGGVDATLGAAEDSIGLPNDFSRMKTFNKEQYDAIYAKLKTDENGLASKLIKDTDANGKTITIADLAKQVKLVTIEEVK